MVTVLFCRGGSRRPPAPPRPQSGIGTGVVVCRGCWWRVMCRKSSPAAAFYGDSRDLICATLCHIRGSIPGPLTAACNARLYFVQNYSGFFQNHRPLFAFLSVNSKNEKRTQRGLKKVVGVQGEEEKTFLKSFCFLPAKHSLPIIIKEKTKYSL